METKVLFALIAVVVLVVGINGLLFYRLKGGKPNQTIRMWQKAARRARDPWEVENQNLKELSERVRELQEKDEQ